MLKKIKPFHAVKFLALALAVSTLSVTTACSSKQDTTIDLKEDSVTISFSWWGTDARNQYTLDAINEFEKLYPNIKIEAQYGDWSGYEKKMDIEVASATEADVMQINYAWINKYSKDKQEFYDLNKLSDDIDLSQFTDESLQYGIYNGILQAVPIALNDMTMYYNKTIYDSYQLELPTTLQDLYDDAEIMSEDGVYPIACTDKCLWFLCVALEETNSGLNLFTSENQLGFQKENLVNLLNTAAELIQKKVVPDINIYDKENLSNGTYAGAVMWLSDGASAFNAAISNGYNYVVGDYLTDETTNTTLSWYVKPATMYAISANTEYPEEAALFMNFLLNSQEMTELQGTEKGIPVSKKAFDILQTEEALDGLQYDAYTKLSENMGSVSKISPFMEDSDLIDVFDDCLNQVIYKGTTPEDAADLLMESLKNVTD